MRNNDIEVFDYDGRGNRSKGVRIGNLIFYFSYKTLIGFSSPKTGTLVIKNYWSTPTARHLNSIDGGNKKSRLSNRDFEAKVQQELKRVNITQPTSPI